MLLNYLYPEMESQWIAIDKGTFYRNYNQDALSIDEKEKKVVLARDGFLRLLPDGLLTKNDDLRGEDFAAKYKELEWRRELLNEAFSPFDTYVFLKKLTIERKASELLDQKLTFLLKSYFGFDINKESNALVKEAAILLPFVSRWRGDLGFVANLLGALMNCEVEMTKGRYSHQDTTRNWLPLKEWFVPFEVRCEIDVKEHSQPQNPDGRLTLNYNTELNQ